MAGISNLWMLSSVVTAAGTINQIVDQNLDPRIEEIMEGGSGTPDTEFAAIQEEKPMLSFTTTAIATAMGLIGWNAYAVAANCDFFFAQVAQGGVRSGGSTAIRVRASKGIIVPKMLRARQDDKTGAKLSYDFYAISTDGEVAPMAVTTGVALPTVTPVSELFTLGPVKMTSGSTNPLAAVQSVDVDFGMKETCLASDGQCYPTFCGILTRRANIGINGLDMTALSTFGINGAALTAWTVYFRKIQQGGTRVPVATATHVKLSGTAGMLRPKQQRGSQDRPFEGEWNISPSWDGTTDVVAISTASAIT